jgi:hypothetical protein
VPQLEVLSWIDGARLVKKSEKMFKTKRKLANFFCAKKIKCAIIEVYQERFD